MKTPILAFMASLLSAALFALPANAQATRTWVSGVGDDANPCSRTAPCKTWAGAIAKTVAGGEIDALDPGGFGALTITKPITLDGGGGQVASVLVAGTNGITVAAGSGDTVIIRNLRFDGLLCSTPAAANCTGSPGLTGISFLSGAALIIDKCDIFGFTNNGIAVTPSSNAKALISNTTIANTATATGNAAVLVKPTGTANVSVVINNVAMQNQLNGVFADGSGGTGIAHVNVNNSTIAGSGNSGVAISGPNGAFDGNVLNTVISYSNGTGAAVAGAHGTLRLGGDTITDNVTGVAASGGGTLLSFKNNQITGNVTDGTPINAVAGYTNGGQ